VSKLKKYTKKLILEKIMIAKSVSKLKSLPKEECAKIMQELLNQKIDDYIKNMAML